MKKIVLISTVILTLMVALKPRTCGAQTWLWAKSAGGTTSNSFGNSVCTDALGNVYVTGSFDNSSIIFGTNTLTNMGYGDLFLVKYDASGNVLWAKSAGGTSDDAGNSVSTDDSGNVYVAGYFVSSSITFGTTTLTNTKPGYSDIFLVKYDASGSVLWAKSAGGSFDDEGNSISIDASGNIYVTGYFQSSSITLGIDTLTRTGGAHDIFLVKYDASGNVLWAKSAGGFSNDVGNSVSTDASGNVYVTGYFESDSITFGTTTLTNAGSSHDIFLAKYDASGKVLWAKNAGGTSDDEGTSVTTDTSGNIYVNGSFSSSSITFGTNTLTNKGIRNIFLAKYDATGNILWAKGAVGTGRVYGNSISTDSSGSVYMAGSFQSSSITFGTTTLTNAGYYNIFLVKYDASGNVLRAKSAGGSFADEGSSVSADITGNVYVTGSFSSDTIIFGTTTLTSANNYNIFLVKYGCGNTSSSQNAAVCDSYYVWNGKVYTASGTYMDTIPNAVGCDSIMTLYLTIGKSSNSFQNATACGSFAWNGNTYTASGTYIDTIPNAAGCDSIMTLNLTINTPPTVALVLDPDTVCIKTGAYPLSGGSPAGGTYSGPGVSTGSFDPAAAGVGLHTITYSYTDGNSCADSMTAQIFVDKCTGIETGLGIRTFVIYPNPFSMQTVLQTEYLLKNATLTVENCMGQTVKQIRNINGQKVVILRDNLTSGPYFIQLTQSNKIMATQKILITD